MGTPSGDCKRTPTKLSGSQWGRESSRQSTVKVDIAGQSRGARELHGQPADGGDAHQLAWSQLGDLQRPCGAHRALLLDESQGTPGLGLPEEVGREEPAFQIGCPAVRLLT
jgi:hypothetical protein